MRYSQYTVYLESQSHNLRTEIRYLMNNRISCIKNQLPLMSVLALHCLKSNPGNSLREPSTSVSLMQTIFLVTYL